MDFWTTILSILVFLLIIYYYSSLKYTQNVFQQHRIPHGKRISILQEILDLFVFPKAYVDMIQTVYNIHQEAKYVGIFHLTGSFLMLRDVEVVKSVCKKNFDAFEDHFFFGDNVPDTLFAKHLIALRGDKWRNMRKLLSPAFTSCKLKMMFPLISNCAMNFSEFLANLPVEKRTMKLKNVFGWYSNDVIASCMFGISVDSIRHPDNDFYVYGKIATDFNMYSLMKILLMQHAPTLTHLLNITVVKDPVRAFFIKMVAETIRMREERGITRPDVIQLMMENRDKQALSIEEMTSQVFSFYLGGFETGRTASSFMAYEIAMNPHIQMKLQQEIDQVLQDTNGQPSYEAINRMAYLSAVINETLRIYPPTPMIDRLCVKDFELPAALPDAKPYVVKKGIIIWIPFYSLHHDPKYFSEPEKFKPERFLKSSEQNECNLDAYYPFGVGPRICIGYRFALLQMKILLFHLLAHCELKTCKKTPIPLKLKKGGFLLKSESDIWLEFVPRQKQHNY
ncbi:cytochrome P450 9e2-like [Odontomachus brunneus]|uniref:cytochrome P450 9e2-like n=1 Tax=Odontomachus brunneus TaxID=486640 RepID=UPI0013F1A6E3|nr:cytochrome P450 9e2-like [Odontomachus brunneus]